MKSFLLSSSKIYPNLCNLLWLRKNLSKFSLILKRLDRFSSLMSEIARVHETFHIRRDFWNRQILWKYHKSSSANTTNSFLTPLTPFMLAVKTIEEWMILKTMLWTKKILFISRSQVINAYHMIYRILSKRAFEQKIEWGFIKSKEKGLVRRISRLNERRLLFAFSRSRLSNSLYKRIFTDNEVLIAATFFKI